VLGLTLFPEMVCKILPKRVLLKFQLDPVSLPEISVSLSEVWCSSSLNSSSESILSSCGKAMIITIKNGLRKNRGVLRQYMLVAFPVGLLLLLLRSSKQLACNLLVMVEKNNYFVPFWSDRVLSCPF